MRISKCDRCGEIIDAPKENVFDILSRVVKQAFNNNSVDLKLSDGETQLDLCPNCQKKLDDWFKFGRKLAKVVEQVPPDEIIRNGIHYKKCDEVKENDT